MPAPDHAARSRAGRLYDTLVSHVNLQYDHCIFKGSDMAYEAQPLPFKPHRLEGLSDRRLISHYENNYGGAVRRLNAIEDRLAGLDWQGLRIKLCLGLHRVHQ